MSCPQCLLLILSLLCFLPTFISHFSAPPNSPRRGSPDPGGRPLTSSFSASAVRPFPFDLPALPCPLSARHTHLPPAGGPPRYARGHPRRLPRDFFFSPFRFDAPAFRGKLYSHPSIKGGHQSTVTQRDEGGLTHFYLSSSGAHVFISTPLPLTLPLLSLRHPLLSSPHLSLH